MTNEEQILETLEEIKLALRALYGDSKNQDSLINTIGRTLSHDFESELSKINASLAKLEKIYHDVEDIQLKVQNLTKMTEMISKLSGIVAKIDLRTLEENMDYIRSTLVSFDGKLTSIYRKLP